MKDLTFISDREISKKLRTNVEIANIIEETNLDKLRKRINQAKGLIIVRGINDNVNRAALENKRVKILLSPEYGRKNDSLHFRNSGLNQVLCKLAKKNNIAIGFNLSDILNNDKLTKINILGKMMQNVRFCRKYKVRMIVGSFAKDKYELRSIDSLKAFASCIGMDGKEINNAFIG